MRYLTIHNAGNVSYYKNGKLNNPLTFSPIIKSHIVTRICWRQKAFLDIFLDGFAMAAQTHTVTSLDTARAVSLFLGVPVTDAVRRIAARINPEGLHAPAGADLSRHPGFQQMVISLGGEDLRNIVEPGRLQQLTDQAREIPLVGVRYAGLGEANAYLAYLFNSSGDGAEGVTSSSAGYDAILDSNIGMITPQNYHRTHYCRAGVDFATFEYLRSHGFSRDNIRNAARDAEALGFRGNREAIIDHALIDRHSIDARGVNAGLQDFRTRLDADQEYRDLARRLAAATSEAEREGLRTQLRARERVIQGESTLAPRLTDPAETPEARAAAERRGRELIERRRRQLGIGHLMGDEASRDITDEQALAQPVISRTATVVPEGSAGSLLTTVTATPGAETGRRDANAGGLLATVSATPAAGTVTPDANAGNLLTTVAVATPDANGDGEAGQGPGRPGPRLAQNTTVRTPTLTG